jgi:hypothetical protein
LLIAADHGKPRPDRKHSDACAPRRRAIDKCNSQHAPCNRQVLQLTRSTMMDDKPEPPSDEFASSENQRVRRGQLHAPVLTASAMFSRLASRALSSSHFSASPCIAVPTKRRHCTMRLHGSESMQLGSI